MIGVEPAEEPPSFEERVRVPGNRALAEKVGERPPVPRTKGRPFKKIASRREDIPPDELPSYWTRALDDLMVRYHHVCAYACFRIHPVTGARSVDHMAPKSRAWDRVYEWSNYRLACSLLNARKRDFSDVLDPFEVRDGWFELELFGFQVRPAVDLDAELSTRIDHTIERLQLNDDAFLRARERDVRNYQEGWVSLEVLCEESPFVARELRRQNRLRPADA
ncbi:MAG: hypothetical protein AB1Z98_03885 [Nannocystaceae bacterium]